jgi:hypothetical protein
MSKTITLESKIEHFRDLLHSAWQIGDFRYGIPDFRVMEKLGATPQSWSRYRPQLVQHCQYNDLIKTELRDGQTIETINIRIRYDRKNKQWYGKRNPLRMIDENGGYKIMTSEELVKFGIIWFAEQDFVY